MKTMKKVIAGASALTLLAMNSAFAATTLTGSITGGNVNTDVIWNNTYNGTNNATGSTSVLVSANVAPILTMNASTGAINFGTLAIGANNQSMTLGTTTNAEGGINVSMASSGLESSTRRIGTYTAHGKLATTGTSTYVVNSTSNKAGTNLVSQNVAATQNVLTTSNVADSNQTTTVNLQANIDGQTEAGNYGDTLTFTVTGNF